MIDNILDWFEKIKKSNDPEKINDFLIEISKDPRFEYLSLLDYFIGYLAPKIHQQIKLNLIYNLGELGKLERIDIKFIDYLIREYYNSDRWIRNEIIVAFRKISMNTDLSEKVKQLIGDSLKESYKPIKENALKALLQINNIPKYVLDKVLIVLNLSDIELNKLSSSILKKNVFKYKNLFGLLNTSENYKLLNKKGIRVLLLEFFNSLAQLEQFKEKISKSNWNNKQKLIFLTEIDVFGHILLKNL